MEDDNHCPTYLMLWAAQGSRGTGTDAHFSHVWRRSADPAAYTALWNICAVPAFLSKLTDTDQDVTAGLKHRAVDLYGIAPAALPSRPPGYADVQWQPHPPPVADLEAALRGRMRDCPQDRLTRCVREVGWVFSGFRPDPTV